MKRIIRHELKEHTLKELRDRQAKIDAVVDPAKRARRTHASWKSKESSRAGKRAFTEIKDVLGRMCNGKRRCMYCEESEASDIEHVRPRSKHPEATFVWENYLFICPVCNSRFKGDKYHEGFMDPSAPEYDLWKRWVFDARTGHYMPLHEDDEGAAKTIEILGFDRREVLARQRRDRLEDLVVGIREYGKAMAKAASPKSSWTRWVELGAFDQLSYRLLRHSRTFPR